LFQSFPLGDRSSVNLRGEYHVENITNFENPAEDDEHRQDSKMDVDTQKPAETPNSSTDGKVSTRGVSFGPKDPPKLYDADSLYPLFWSLQESFSQPLKLFDSTQFAKFKSSLVDTMKAFQAIHQSEGSSRPLEASRRNLKRKNDDEGLEEAPEAFNPKYLTSKDLFELEVFTPFSCCS
jgi:THO complex subunit 1